MFFFAVCDEEASCCEREKKMITSYFQERNLKVMVDTYNSDKEIRDLGEMVTKYDAIFLEAGSKKVNGIDLAQWIREQSGFVFVVFVAGNITYAPLGYKVGAIRYILKEKEDFEENLEECLDYIQDKIREQRQGMVIEFPNRKAKVPVEKILYVESKLHQIFCYVMEENGEVFSYAKYGKLSDLEQDLFPLDFCRTHQSFLVNMNQVIKVERYEVTLQGDVKINISKKYYKDLETRFLEDR